MLRAFLPEFGPSYCELQIVTTAVVLTREGPGASGTAPLNPRPSR
jgi:hypothetical protein